MNFQRIKWVTVDLAMDERSYEVGKAEYDSQPEREIPASITYNACGGPDLRGAYVVLNNKAEVIATISGNNRVIVGYFLSEEINP